MNGVRYVAPAGWTRRIAGTMIVLTAPEGDAQVAIIDARAGEPDAAVREAWALYRAAPPPALKLRTEQPGRRGWERSYYYEYTRSPNDKRGVSVSALGYGSSWTIQLWDGSDATFNKRDAEFGLVDESLRPAGYSEESFAGRRAHPLDAARLARLDAFVEHGRSALGVPGVAIAVVQKGELIHARGFGTRELGKPEPVDADTLFMIASNTKALTTLLLAQLVDQGKLRWDEPVTEAYPGFVLGDPTITAATRIEHLVCACTGLPRKDLEMLFESGSVTPLAVVESLARIQPTTKFGETFQYSNSLAASAGYVAAHVVQPEGELGAVYDRAMHERIFAPLGMSRTTFDFERALASDHAAPHGWDVAGVTGRVPDDFNRFVLPRRPGGGAWSSARDLVQYVRLELARGIAPGGQRLVSAKSLLARRKAYANLGENGSYGMGLFRNTRYGVERIDHGGSLRGYKSQMVWLPEHDVGAVILTNSDEGGMLLGPFERYLLELLFDGKPEASADLEASLRNAREWMAKERPRLALPPDPVVVSALAPRYAQPELGALAVVRAGAEVRFDVGEWSTAVASRRNDDGSVSFVAITPGSGGFDFVVGKDDKGRTLTVREAQHEYVFRE